MSSEAPQPARAGRSVHKPVLLRETLQYLNLEPGLTVVDGTVGGGGHSREILKQIGSQGRLIGLDRDPAMLRSAARVLDQPNCSLHHASYADLDRVLDELALPTVDRLLLDLGLSSDQIEDESRGFRFDSTGPLDLRFDVSQGEPAWQLIEKLEERPLEELLRRYGEQRFGAAIARALTERRERAPVRTAAELVNVVEQAVPPAVRAKSRKHPATRVFQALRIAVNDELRHLERALREVASRRLASGGRVVVIAFHSLEDAIVKREFRNKARWDNLTPKPVSPRATERKVNPRSRSAKLRAAEKI